MVDKQWYFLYRKYFGMGFKWEDVLESKECFHMYQCSKSIWATLYSQFWVWLFPYLPAQVSVWTGVWHTYVNHWQNKKSLLAIWVLNIWIKADAEFHPGFVSQSPVVHDCHTTYQWTCHVSRDMSEISAAHSTSFPTPGVCRKKDLSRPEV